MATAPEASNSPSVVPAVHKAVCEQSGLSFNHLPDGTIHSIFSYLGPKDLFRASGVCTHWKDLCSTMCNQIWRAHYARRWRPPLQVQGWQAEYSSKMQGSRGFGSKALVDVLYGHSGAVTSLALLPACNLVATGSADCTVRLWDLQAGLPVGTSRHLKGTVRALALDERLLVSSGSHDGAMRIWRPLGSGADTRFDLGTAVRLQAHSGPVVSLALDARCIYSASWDHSVRIWDRDTLRRVSLLAFPDWVNGAKPRGGHLLVTAGSTLHVHSLATGQGISKHEYTARAGADLAWTSPLQVEGSRDSRLVFLGGPDGTITALDLRAPKQPAGVLWNQTSPILDLSFEDPWLAAATNDQSVLLIDTEAALTGGQHSGSNPSATSARGVARVGAVRQRLAGPGGPVCCVDIADRWLACGAMVPVVRTWDFQQAGRTAARPRTAPRRPRGSRRSRNRFAFAPESDEEDDGEDGPAGPASSVQIPLSQSLPANMAGQVGIPPGNAVRATPETDASEEDEASGHERPGSSAQTCSRSNSSGDESDGGQEVGQHDCNVSHRGIAIPAGRTGQDWNQSYLRSGSFTKGTLERQRVPLPPPIARRSAPETAEDAGPASSMHSWRIRRPRRNGEREQVYREAVQTVG